MNTSPHLPSPRFSVLITSYRSLRYLQDCVGSVLQSTGPSFEVLFLENGSPEPEADYLEKNFPDARLKIFRVPDTRYFAAGINYLAKHARGEYLVLLNSDTRAEPEWLQVFDDYLRTSGFEAAQADLRDGHNPSQRESLGYRLDRLGFTMHNAEEAMVPSGRIFCARGAAFAVRRDVFEQLDGLDENYRMYFEETDLCWRINLLGHRIGYAPGSIVYHMGGGSARKSFFNWTRFRFIRNRIVSLFKNYGPAWLVLYLPLHILLCIASGLGQLLRGRPREALAEELGVAAAILLLPTAIGRRAKIQSQRTVSDRDLVRQGLIARFKYLGG